LGNTSGIVCDGAKSSCAAKIASSVDAAIMGHKMAMRGKTFLDGDGIIKKDIEKTINGVGWLAKKGMKETDVELLKIMLS
jgi:L-cysteine desulfidase